MPSLLLCLVLACPAAPVQDEARPQSGAPVASVEPVDLSPLAPADSDLLLQLRSPRYSLEALHRIGRALVDPAGPFAALLPQRPRLQLQAALSFTEHWPELAVGKTLHTVSRRGLLIGLREQQGRQLGFAVLDLGDEAAAEQAASVLRVYSIPVRVCAGGLCVLSRIEADLDLLQRNAEGAAAPARFGASPAVDDALLELRVWIGARVLARVGPMPELRDQPAAALILAGLGDGLRGSDGVSVSGTWSERGLALQARIHGFAAALPEAARAVWNGGPAVWPAKVEDTVVRLRLGRDLAALVAGRKGLLDAAGQPRLDRFLQGLEFGFQGARAEDQVLADLGPSTTALLALGSAEDRVEESGVRYCLPRGLLSYGHGGSLLAERIPQALRVLVVAGNSGRQRKGQEPYRIQDAGGEGLRLATAAVHSGLAPRPYGETLRPTVASTERRLYIASSPELVRAVVARGETEALPADEGLEPLDRIEVDGRVLAEGLLQNLDLLAAQAVLDRGESYAEARLRIRRLAELARLLPSLGFRDGFRGADLELALELRTRPELYDLTALAESFDLQAEAGTKPEAAGVDGPVEGGRR